MQQWDANKRASKMEEKSGNDNQISIDIANGAKNPNTINFTPFPPPSDH